MNGLFLYRSSWIELLAEALAANLQGSLPDDPLAPLSVVVGSRGMERWLRHRLASTFRICANLTFPFPTAALEAAFPPSSGSWSLPALTWRLAARLPALAEEEAARPLARWLAARGSSGARAIDRDRLALAQELAQVLDRAAVYRPEWVEAWEAEREVPGPHAPPSWQGVLWRALRDPEAGPHPARLWRTAAPLPGEPLHLFGLSGLAPATLQAWERVAEVRPVHLYRLEPTRHYVGDWAGPREMRGLSPEEQEERLEDQHPLLTALGRLARDQAELLLALNPLQDQDLPGAFDPPPGASALAILQRDLLAARTLADLRARRDARPLDPADDSFQVHLAHGPTRQVEVLREVLYALLADHPDLEPRDILVLTPDVATFAPLVRAAFSEPRGPLPRLPVVVADLGLRELNPLADAALAVLALASGRLTAPDWLALLSRDPVARRFELGPDDLTWIRTALQEAGARTGLDQAERARLGLPALDDFTFDFALDRMALGLTLSDEDGREVCGRAPYDPLEGEATERVGKLALALRRLGDWRERLVAPRPLSAWVEALIGLLDDFTLPPPESAQLRQEVLDSLRELAAEGAAQDPVLHPEVLPVLLEQRFLARQRGDRPATGKITLCSFAPMRSVPFRVVAMLGMDDGAFPRAPGARGFDAVAARPRPGDPDPREEDRNLLLETLLAVRSHLVVLATGRDPRTDRPLAPAPAVGLLLDLVDRTFHDPADPARPASARWISQHPIQPFSASGFRPPPPGAARRRRFDPQAAAIAQVLAAPRQPRPAWLSWEEPLPDPDRPRQITLAELERWTRRPLRTLLRERLGLRPAQALGALPEREGLEPLGGLEGWQLGDQLTRAWLAGERSPERARAALTARAALPPGAPGRRSVEKAWAALVAAWPADPPAGAGQTHPLRLDLEIPLPLSAEGGPPTWTVQVVGQITVYGQELFTFGHDAPDKPRRLLPPWIQLLAAAAAGLPVSQARICGADARGQPAERRLLRPADPRALLVHLLSEVARSRQLPRRLVEKTSFAWVLAERQGGEDPARAALDAARSAWVGGYAGEGEGADEGLALIFGELPPWGDADSPERADFTAAAHALWDPLWQASSEAE